MDNFKLDLKDMKEGLTKLSFALDDAFFATLDEAEVKRGQLKCDVAVKRTGNLFELKFHTDGVVVIPCDLCLDDMEQPIVTDSKLLARLGGETSEDGDIVGVAEEEGTLDVAWFVYESIALAIPIRHVHAPGKCNVDMMKVLEEHSAARSGTGNEQSATDSRWAALAKLKFEN